MEQLRRLLDRTNQILINLKKDGPNRNYSEKFVNTKNTELEDILAVCELKLNEIRNSESLSQGNEILCTEISDQIKFAVNQSKSILQTKIKKAVETVEEQSSTQKLNTLEIGKVQEIEENRENQEIKNRIMAHTFDLRTATNLLPVMDNTEEVTKRLIDSLEMYDLLVGPSEKTLLIHFVLKTRLSEAAKVRLKSEYSSIAELLKDMRHHLLPQKSDTSLMHRLCTAKQGKETLENFGKTIESLFVDLTVTQAKGNSSAYEILKKNNERIAISSFANGLKDSQLSTVIRARNYDSLKDAIRGALDEENPRSESAQIFHARGKHSGRRNFHRGNSRQSNRGNSYQNSRGNSRGNFRGNNRGYSRGNSNSYRGNSNRGNSNGRSNNRGGSNSNTGNCQSIQIAEEENVQIFHEENELNDSTGEYSSQSGECFRSFLA